MSLDASMKKRNVLEMMPKADSVVRITKMNLFSAVKSDTFDMFIFTTSTDVVSLNRSIMFIQGRTTLNFGFIEETCITSAIHFLEFPLLVSGIYLCN